MIRLTDDIVIEVDDTNYTLVQKTGKFTKKGVPIRKAIGYYVTLEMAVKAAIEFLNKLELSGDVYSLKQALDIIQKNTDNLNELLKRG